MTLLVKFWGTRGSLPSPVKHKDIIQLLDDLVIQAKKQGIKDIDTFINTVKSEHLIHPLSYGGNTTCIEISKAQESFIVDMGSGLREVGTTYVGKGRKEFNIFLTHMHWDHIVGLPFFLPIYIPGNHIVIHHVHENTPEFVKINFNGVNFPVKFDTLPARIEFKKIPLYQAKKIGSFSVTPFQLDHPGNAYGYRFENQDKVATKAITIGIDSEYKRMTSESFKDDYQYYKNCDLLVFDGQYEMAELANKFDWGHCSPNLGVDLALREGIRRIVIAHHDPWSDREKLQRMYDNTKKYLQTQFHSYKNNWTSINKEGPKLYFAYDGLEIDVSK